MNKNLLIDLIRYSFGLNTIFNSNEYNIPNKLFGFFVSYERKLNIHGCIGLFEDREISKNYILENIFKIAFSSMNEDYRKHNFKKNIQYVPEAKIKIYFMKYPFYKINSNQIDNYNYGIFIKSNKKKATYLPKVFTNENSNYILSELKNKARIIDEQYEIYNYECYIYDTNLLQIMNINILKNIITNSFINIKNNYKTYFPLFLKNNKYVIDNKEYVRNLSSIYYYIVLAKILKFEINYDIVENDLNYYYKSYKKTREFDHSYIYFILICNELNISNKYFNLNNEINYYIELLNKNEVEINFELPQILTFLTIITKDINKILPFIEKQLDRIKNNNDIFFLNLFCSTLFYLYCYHKIKYDMKLIINNFIYLFNNIINNYNPIETNYLSVMYQCVCVIYYIDNNDEILNYMFYLFIELEKRRKLYYEFTNKTIRLDITFHVYEGFLFLLNNNNYKLLFNN